MSNAEFNPLNFYRLIKAQITDPNHPMADHDFTGRLMYQAQKDGHTTPEAMLKYYGDRIDAMNDPAHALADDPVTHHLRVLAAHLHNADPNLGIATVPGATAPQGPELDTAVNGNRPSGIFTMPGTSQGPTSPGASLAGLKTALMRGRQ